VSAAVEALPSGRAVATEVVAVVVPAHNEEELIGACVAAIGRAAAHPDLAGVAVHLVLVLDDCHDETVLRAEEALAAPELLAPERTGGALTASVVAVSVRNVGRARAFGVTQVFFRFGTIDPEAVWLTTTDADSVVPPDWLAHHLDLRRQGADACAGTVEVDNWDEHPESARERFDALYRPEGQLEFGHPHVHGTNLGVSMAAYLEVGGFSPLVTAEDHALWEALAAAGRQLVATPKAPVTTSGRRHGRSPAGFADTLVRLGSEGGRPT
jgi:cellulose synthase/poly-beta-1,6-N-acetylglucosamine synthase-like glycosyltransferase